MLLLSLALFFFIMELQRSFILCQLTTTVLYWLSLQSRLCIFSQFNRIFMVYKDFIRRVNLKASLVCSSVLHISAQGQAHLL